jgi:hypothetical protein
MPYVGFEPTIPASQRVKAVHALDRSATVTGYLEYLGSFFIHDVSAPNKSSFVSLKLYLGSVGNKADASRIN